MRRKIVDLPKELVEELLAIYESGDREMLSNYIISLRAQKWPLRAIGEPIGMSKSTVQFWERAATADAVDTTYSPRAIESAGVRTVRWSARISDGDLERFRTLSEEARKVRSQTPENSSQRIAAEELDLLIEVYLNKMVTVTDIANAMGVTRRAVRARMERRNG